MTDDPKAATSAENQTKTQPQLQDVEVCTKPLATSGRLTKKRSSLHPPRTAYVRGEHPALLAVLCLLKKPWKLKLKPEHKQQQEGKHMG